MAWAARAAPPQCPSNSHEVSFDRFQLEGGFCPDCPDPSSQSQSFQAAAKTFASVPALSCFQSSIKQTIQRHSICPGGDPDKLEKQSSKPICFSGKYISGTARVFYDVAKCLGMRQPEYFFALINRESRFQITARSATGASCYGQLTGIAIADVNSRFLPYRGKDAKSCGAINNHFERLPTKGHKRSRTATCAAHSNPYSCLMYSAVYYMQALKKARQLIDDLDIVIVTMKGKPKERLIFKSREKFEKYFSRPGRSKDDIVKEESISLLQDKETAAQILAFQSYNGGPGNARNKFKSYVNDIKTRIWGGGRTSKNYLGQIFSKKPYGIGPGDFLETFSKYSLANRVRGETASFPRNVLNDYQSVAGHLAPSCGGIPYKKLTSPPGKFTAPGMI